MTQEREVLSEDAPAVGAARLSPLLRRVVAPNPGPFTYTGTCSYIVGAGDVAIIDPGPANAQHMDALMEAVASERLRMILVTHTHRDHSPGANLLRERTGAPVAGCAAYTPPTPGDERGPGLDASHDRAYAPDRVLTDGERLSFGGATIEAVATPGHTANHLCYALLEAGELFTGDHVMAWSTTVVAPPDGSMRDYMASIERLRLREDLILWPGHGGPVRHPARYLRAIAHHRRAREISILQRLEDGDDSIAAIVARIYEGVDARLHYAAALNVLAHMEDLIARGLVVSDSPASLAARYTKN